MPRKEFELSVPDLYFFSGNYSGWYVYKFMSENGQDRRAFLLERSSFWQARGILCEKGKKTPTKPNIIKQHHMTFNIFENYLGYLG